MGLERYHVYILNFYYSVVYPFIYLFFYIISAFHLSYNMLLNQIRCEDGNPENLLRNSFYQFQADRNIPNLEVSFCRQGVLKITHEGSNHIAV